MLVRQTIKVSGIDGIALTKLDVLDELDEIKICVQYELDGEKIDYLPAAVEDQQKIKPIYKTFQVGNLLLAESKILMNYPKMLKNIFAVEDFIGAKISSILQALNEKIHLIENPSIYNLICWERFLDLAEFNMCF